MRLTADQIMKMAEAAKDNGDTFYIEEGSDGRIAFGAIKTTEKRKVIALGKVKA